MGVEIRHAGMLRLFSFS